jgi:hypothetical protein
VSGACFRGWEVGYSPGILGLRYGNEVYMSRSSYLCSLDTHQRVFLGFVWHVAERT